MSHGARRTVRQAVPHGRRWLLQPAGMHTGVAGARQKQRWRRRRRRTTAGPTRRACERRRDGPRARGRCRAPRRPSRPPALPAPPPLLLPSAGDSRMHTRRLQEPPTLGCSMLRTTRSSPARKQYIAAQAQLRAIFFMSGTAVLHDGVRTSSSWCGGCRSRSAWRTTRFHGARCHTYFGKSRARCELGHTD